MAAYPFWDSKVWAFLANSRISFKSLIAWVNAGIVLLAFAALIDVRFSFSLSIAAFIASVITFLFASNVCFNVDTCVEVSSVFAFKLAKAALTSGRLAKGFEDLFSSLWNWIPVWFKPSNELIKLSKSSIFDFISFVISLSLSSIALIFSLICLIRFSAWVFSPSSLFLACVTFSIAFSILVINVCDWVTFALYPLVWANDLEASALTLASPNLVIKVSNSATDFPSNEPLAVSKQNMKV